VRVQIFTRWVNQRLAKRHVEPIADVVEGMGALAQPCLPNAIQGAPPDARH
jgi:hypothetical protein